MKKNILWRITYNEKFMTMVLGERIFPRLDTAYTRLVIELWGTQC